MKLFGCRHAQTSFNVQGLVLGHTPGELTEEGKANTANLLVPEIKALGPKVVAWSSGLERARQTVQIVQAACPYLTVTYTDLLEERDFGEYEGKPHAELAATGFWELPPEESRFGAESEAAFTRRIARFVRQLSTVPDDATIVLFCHIGVLNRLHYLENPAAFAFINYPNSRLVAFDAAGLIKNSQLVLR